jgi:hypothetical protein
MLSTVMLALRQVTDPHPLAPSPAARLGLQRSALCAGEGDLLKCSLGHDMSDPRHNEC